MHAPDNLLSAAERATLQAFFQLDFAELRIEVGALPDRCNALALGRGDRVQVSPRLLGLPRRARLRMLCHELMHVAQQRAGRVHGPRDTLCCSPQLEAEADLAAALFDGPRGDPLTRAEAARLLVCRPSAQPRRASAWQPVVSIQGNVRTFDQLWQALTTNAAPDVFALKGVTASERDKIRTKLRHWVDAPAHRSYFSFAKKGHNKQFGSTAELARALVGRVRSTESKQIEAQLAAAVDGSDTIKQP